MTNPFSTSTRPTEIVIKPVNNGWIVILPEVNNDINSMIPQMIKGIKSALPGNEIDEIIQKANEHENTDEQPPFTREQNVHIFHTFDKVLAFLKVQIDE